MGSLRNLEGDSGAAYDQNILYTCKVSVKYAIFLKKWAGEIAQWLSTNTTVAKDLGSVPSTHVTKATHPHL